MHPIERLRYVARASGAPQGVLVQETARALGAFTADPQGLVTACRRIVARQPTSGPLLWLAARVLAAGDPAQEVWAAAGEVAADGTSAALADALPEGAVVVVVGWPEEAGDALVRRGDLDVLVVDPGAGPEPDVPAGVEATAVPSAGLGAAAAAADLVLVEPTAVGPAALLAPAGSRAAAAVAAHAGVAVWAVAGVGRWLPARMWDGLLARAVTDEPWEADHEVVPLDLVDQVVGPAGPEPPAVAARRTDCPVVPELFRGEAV